MKKKRANRKEIGLRRIEESNTAIEHKIPLAKCREILNRQRKKYTDEQILLIRDWFYALAAIMYNEYHYEQKNTTILLNTNQNNDYEESHYLRAG